MDNLKYAHAVGRLRVLETRLLDKAKIDRMIESLSPKEALKVLEETEYSSSLASIKRVEDYEFVLRDALKNLYKEIYSISPEKELVDVLCYKYDYHNIKVLIKSKILDKDFDNILIDAGSISIELLRESINEENYRDLSSNMREGIEKALKEFEEDKDPQKIDVILDKYMFSEMLFKASKLDNSFLLDYIKLNIDLTNIKTLIRVKKQEKSRNFFDEVIVDGGNLDRGALLELLNETEENISKKLYAKSYNTVVEKGLEEYLDSSKLSLMEKLSDNFLMDYAKKAKFVSFGAEPIIAYILAKETEIKIIRIIMIGKLNNVSAEVIRERLRDIYV